MHSFLYKHLVSRLPDKYVEKMGGPYFKLSSYLTFPKMVDLPVNVASVKFPNPIGMPAGWIDDPDKLYTANRLGVGIPTIKTITPYPKAGNPYPRIIRLPNGMVNSLGLPNKGVNWWQNNFEKPDFPIIMSIKGNNFDEWVELIEKLEKKTDILELNLSCPNIGDGVLDLQSSKEIIENITGLTDTKIFLKLSPEFSPSENKKLIDAIRDKIDGVTAINTLPVIDQTLGNPNSRGGLSGKPIYQNLKNLLEKLRSDYTNMTDLPIIATGGIFSGKQAWDILRNYKCLPCGLTGFLMLGPRFYMNIASYIENQLSDDITLNILLEGEDNFENN